MFKITDATEELLPVVNSLAHRTWPHTFASILSPSQIAYMLEWMYSIPSLQEQVGTKGHRFLLVGNSVEFVGYASYEINYDADSAKLHKIYVLPECQGTGAGKMLMDEVISRTAAAGNKYLLLNVNRDNPAVGFYRKKGFEIIKTEDIDIGDGYYMNDYVMRLTLS